MESLDLRFRAAPRSPCRVRVGRGVLERLVDDLAARPPGRVLVLIADANVAPLYGEPLAARLRAAGLDARLLTFRGGESAKTRTTKARLEDELLRLGIGREGAVLAVGGGVTGDLAGFVASTWHRGIPLIQVPTSLLAMVDAALGGKTAVNLRGGKNLVGSFHQPLAVYADVSVLRTLPERHYVEGFAEVIKAAAVADAALFRRLEAVVGPLRSRCDEELERVVLAAMRIKAAVVRDDEREAGRRAMLNFGHTVAHAVETVSGYRVRHGRAVALGLCVEGDLAVEATGLPRGDADRLAALVAAFGLPCRIPARTSIDALVAATKSDKKVREGRVRYALPRALGRMPPGDAVTVAVAESSLRAALENARPSRRGRD